MPATFSAHRPRLKRGPRQRDTRGIKPGFGGKGHKAPVLGAKKIQNRLGKAGVENGAAQVFGCKPRLRQKRPGKFGIARQMGQRGLRQMVNFGSRRHVGCPETVC